MAGEVASAFVSLMPSARGFGSASERQIGPQMTGVAKRTGSRFGKVFAYASMSPLKAIGAAAIGLFAVAKVKQFFQGAIAEAREAQKVSAITAQVIKSTGGAANISAGQVASLATSISNLTGIDDEAIQSGANLLLTFKNLRNEAGKGNDVFNQATKIITDMSVALGTDVKGSAIQVGKALNDPIKGISALTRVGVTFTDQQKEQITALVESGKRLQAQKIILGELRTEFGGTAAAAATAGDRFKVAFANFQESVGTALLPYLDRLLLKGVSVIGFLQNDVPRAFEAFKNAAAPAVAIVREFVEDHLPAFKTALAALAGAGLSSLVSLIGGSLVSAIGVLVGALVSPIALVGALAGAFLYAYRTSDQFRVKVNEVASWVQANLIPALLQVGQVLRNDVGPALLSAATFLATEFYPTMIRFWAAIAQRLQPALVALVQTYTSRVLPIQKQVVAGVQQWTRENGPLIQTLGKLTAVALLLGASVVSKVLPPVLRFSTALSGPAFNALIAVMNASNRAMTALGELAREFGQAVSAATRFTAGVVAAVGKAINIIQQIPARAKAALGNVGSLLYSSGQELIDGFGRGMLSRLGDIASKAASIASKIKGYFPGSPVKEGPLTSWNNGAAGKRLMQMLEDGLLEGGKGVTEAALKVATNIADALVDKMSTIRDRIKSQLDGVRSDFAALAGSVTSAFTADLFSSESVSAFTSNLVSQNMTLRKVLEAFKKLKKWGVPADFLSQLFASGNSALILEMAAGSRQDVMTTAGAFSYGQSLSEQLGSQVARNQYGPQLTRLENRLERANKHLRHLDTLAEDIGKALNNTVGSGQRRAS